MLLSWKGQDDKLVSIARDFANVFIGEINRRNNEHMASIICMGISIFQDTYSGDHPDILEQYSDLALDALIERLISVAMKNKKIAKDKRFRISFLYRR